MNTAVCSFFSPARDLFVALLDPVQYSFLVHRHHLAAWVASRATSSRACRFRVKTGRAILEEVNLHALLTGDTHWPHPARMDAFVHQLQDVVIAEAARHGLAFSHGIAAKLINMYLKTAVLLGSSPTAPLMAALHPPIDREMLNTIVRARLGDRALWRSLQAKGWTAFDHADYQAAINGLRVILGDGQPLWMAEQFWGGYQGASRAT